MNGFVEYPLEEGGSILVEVSIPESEGALIKVASAGDLTVRVATTFENALGSIRPLANAVVSKL